MTGSDWINLQWWAAGKPQDVGSTHQRRRAEPTDAGAEVRVELELRRTPDHCDTRIARACGTNVIVVRHVRERLGTYPTRPV